MKTKKYTIYIDTPAEEELEEVAFQDEITFKKYQEYFNKYNSIYEAIMEKQNALPEDERNYCMQPLVETTTEDFERTTKTSTLFAFNSFRVWLTKWECKKGYCFTK